MERTYTRMDIYTKGTHAEETYMEGTYTQRGIHTDGILIQRVRLVNTPIMIAHTPHLEQCLGASKHSLVGQNRLIGSYP